MRLGLDNRQVACAKILLERISKAKKFNNKSMMIITYKDLSMEVAKRYGISIHYHTELGNEIGEVVHWCVSEMDKNTPFMSVIVGSPENSYMPKKGYWGLYDDHRGKSIQPEQRDEEYIKELNYVFEYDWSDISEIVDKIAVARGI